ncbi:MAG: beta-lactamase family protein [Gemmatimonadaceae bacterium]|jgi:CubicO group peptidase (beta-lactamase class C family)|nr:beta-lactamase family protein [Gemmatimonadaceae bacterium]
MASALDAMRMERLDRWLDGLIAARRIPGAVVLVLKNGQVAYERAYGVRELGRPEPLRSDDIFRVASQTKAITSLAAMLLWEEGRFQLDDAVERYLPSFAKQAVLERFNPTDSSYTTRPARRRTTVRQLFTHTSGLDYADIGSEEMRAIYAKAGITALGREGDVLAERIDVLGRLPLRADPGERFIYSLSLDVLGRLVEVWSGMPFDQFVRTRITEPLGMRDTWFSLPADRRARLVTLHEWRDSVLAPLHERIGGTHADFPARPMTYFAGGAGLSSTVHDYARFLQLFLNHGDVGGVRLLGRKTVDLMLANQIAPLEPAYGLGFALETTGNDHRTPLSVGAFSWGGAFKTTYWAEPREGVVALLFTNVLGSPLDLESPFRTFVTSALR